jgi:hypothetical protein
MIHLQQHRGPGLPLCRSTDTTTTEKSGEVECVACLQLKLIFAEANLKATVTLHDRYVMAAITGLTSRNEGWSSAYVVAKAHAIADEAIAARGAK